MYSPVCIIYLLKLHRLINYILHDCWCSKTPFCIIYFITWLICLLQVHLLSYLQYELINDKSPKYGH